MHPRTDALGRLPRHVASNKGRPGDVVCAWFTLRASVSCLSTTAPTLRVANETVSPKGCRSKTFDRCSVPLQVLRSGDADVHYCRSAPGLRPPRSDALRDV